MLFKFYLQCKSIYYKGADLLRRTYAWTRKWTKRQIAVFQCYLAENNANISSAQRQGKVLSEKFFFSN